MNRKCDRNLIVHPFPAPTPGVEGYKRRYFTPDDAANDRMLSEKRRFVHKATHA